MGLCKCPKKKVTSLFCFEHRVNVCEYCLVSNHAKCIVQSYLQWLQDSDYNPKCELCQKLLADEECVRLLCYDIFHWNCLNHFAKQLPSHTAPAGYSCPNCKKPIFPAGNVVSPVADVLRKLLMQVNWARAGLGLPLIVENHMTDSAIVKQEPAVNEDWVQNTHNIIEVGDVTPSTSAHYAPRKLFDSTHGENCQHTTFDHDDDKYKRRSALDWLSRWFRSRSMQNQKDPNAAFKRFVILIIFGLIGLFTLIAIFTRVGRAVADKDPSLDLKNNPNIRVGDINAE